LGEFERFSCQTNSFIWGHKKSIAEKISLNKGIKQRNEY
jgi:hypothetical protein